MMLMSATPSDRCPWCRTDSVYVDYHDHEWGVPCRDPQKLWESLVLESFQAGLSWITILRRRDGFRAAFAGFAPAVIAEWGPTEVESLLQDRRIIRHRGKIDATIAAAKAFERIQAREGFSTFIWSFVGGQTVQNHRTSMAEVPAHTPQSAALSAALRNEGFRFVGPTTAYAFMQAVGMVNDHLVGCHRHAALAQ
jgi:DNA-3-methyladenine glycosylase I